MVVRLGVASLAVLAAFVVTACDEPETTGQHPLFPTTSAGTGPVAPACKAGEPCYCASGLAGQTVCTQKIQSCDCAQCEATSTIPTSEPPHFQPCTGDVVGSWSLKSIDYAAVTYQRNGIACPVDVVEAGPTRMLLQMLADGTGDVFFGGLTAQSVVLASCLSDGQVGTSCGNLPGCRQNGCGLCVCGEEGQPQGYFPYDFGWQLVGNTIALTGGGGDALASYQYCVNGNELTLTVPNTQVLYQLERVEFAGKPLACAERSPETCVVPVNPKNPARHAESEDDACHFACTGGPNCDAATYDTQCRDAGCTWDVTQCAGDPAFECLFGDYGVIPGCTITPLAAP